jgi:hypothetical protein
MWSRDRTSSQRSSSPGASTLASERLRFATSLSRNEEDREAGEADREEVARDAEHRGDRVARYVCLKRASYSGRYQSYSHVMSVISWAKKSA